MALRHNCVQGSYTRPVSSELDVTELVINQTDGTLWTKRPNGTLLQINSEVNPVDRSWKFIGDTGQPPYKNGFIPVEDNNAIQSGIGYRLFDHNTLHVTGRVKVTGNKSRGFHTLFTFDSDITQRLASLDHQYGVATISPTLNAGQYLLLNTNGNLELVIFATIFNNDEVMLDTYFQLNGR